MSSFFSKAEDKVNQLGDKAEAGIEAAKAAPAAPIPAFSDIAKSSNDLLNKDFYHTAAANLEVKTKAPNGVSYTVKGKAGHSGPISGSLEGKHADKANGITNTLTWTTLNTIDAKIELDNSITKGLKAEILGTFKPESSATPAAAKLNLHWKQPQYHLRVFGDLLKGPTANADLVLGHGGFVVGGEAGYDVQKAALTKWSLAAGYLNKEHSAAITGSNNLSIFSASFFKNVSDEIQAGAKATYDAKSSGQVGLELASRYKVDSLSFAKAKINDKGVAALSYNTQIRPGFTFGVGASFDTQKLNEATHTVGTHFAFEA